MRKLLAILLIATIACNGFVETIESLNEDMIFDYFELDKEAVELNIFSGIGNIFNKIWKTVKGVVKWLKKKGLWDKIVSIAKTVGKIAAKQFCEKYAKTSKCSDIVDKFLNK